MTKLTKLALEQKNAALASENAELRKQIEDMKLEREIAKFPARRAQYDVPHPRLEAMRIAREIAMATGRTVKV